MLHQISSTIQDIFYILAAIWFILLIISLFRLSNRKDMFLPVKVFWAFVIFLAPFIGLVFYLIYSRKTVKRLKR